jgi:uncharacterized protein YaaQ
MAKLVLAIVFNNEAVEPLSQALVAQQFAITRISSMGGFLRRHNTTLVIGVEDHQLEQVTTIIREMCLPYSREEGHAVTFFVLDAVEIQRV